MLKHVLQHVLQHLLQHVLNFGGEKRRIFKEIKNGIDDRSASIMILAHMAATLQKSVDPTVSAIAALLGSRGGKKRSEAKISAARKNVRKAIAARIKAQKST